MNELDYQTVQNLVRTWGTDSQRPPYDFNGVVHLMLAALDNLRDNALDAELEGIGLSMTDGQRAFLTKIADHASSTSDADIAAEGD